MPLKLIPRSPLPPFTYSPSPPSPAGSQHADDAESQAGPSKGTKPPTDFFAERDMHVFGAHPLGGREEAGRAIVRCPMCRRPTMEASYAEHQRICKHVLEGVPLVAKRATSGKTLKTGDNLKKRRASEDSADESPRKRPNKQPSDYPINLLSAGPDGEGAAKGMKLKKSELKRLKKEREREARKEMKEKEKAEIAERKRLRISGPINLDKQCGVINDKGAPCARSLTCKTHTVGAKRSVPGRSRGYDELYLDWQRANNPRFKEPSKAVPSKKEREGGTGTKGMASGPGGAGAGSGRKEGRHRPDDEDVGGRQMSESEIREVVHLAKVAGDRCRHVIGLIGSTGNKVHPSALAAAAGGGSRSNDTQALARQRRVQQQIYALPRPTQCTSTWSGDFGFAGVGDMLVKALAARPAPAPPPSRQAPPILIIKPPGAGEKRAQVHVQGQAGQGEASQKGGDESHGTTKSKAQKMGGSSAIKRTNAAAMASTSQSDQVGRTVASAIDQPDYVPHLLSSQGQGHAYGQGMNAQAMIAAAAAAASAVNANSLANGMGGNGGNPNNNAAMIAMMNNLGAGMQLQLPAHVQMQLQNQGMMPMQMPMQMPMSNGMGGQGGFQQGMGQGFG